MFPKLSKNLSQRCDKCFGTIGDIANADCQKLTNTP